MVDLLGYHVEPTYVYSFGHGFLKPSKRVPKCVWQAMSFDLTVERYWLESKSGFHLTVNKDCFVPKEKPWFEGYIYETSSIGQN